MAQTMVATVNANTTRREVAVVVEHENWQSYSKAVTPKAKKAFKAWVSENIMFGSLLYVEANFTLKETLQGRSMSVFYFTY